MMPPTTYVAKLDTDGLDRLERQLAIQAESLLAVGQPVLRGAEREGNVVTDDRTRSELAAASQDIVASYARGVQIAPQTESRPLIPLFEASGRPVPPEMKVDHETMGYDFYSVEVVFTILLPVDEYPLSAEFDLQINDDVANPARKTRPIQLFPGRQDIEYFRADFEGAVGINADMKLSLPLSAAGALIPFLQVSPEARLKAGIVVGPLSFPFRKAAIEVIGEQSQKVHWRYNLQTTLKGANTFKSILILKIANEARSVGFDATLNIVPHKASWHPFTQQLPPIPAQGRLPVELAR